MRGLIKHESIFENKKNGNTYVDRKLFIIYDNV